MVEQKQKILEKTINLKNFCPGGMRGAVICNIALKIPTPPRSLLSESELSMNKG